jgi:hypothetical protein
MDEAQMVFKDVAISGTVICDVLIQLANYWLHLEVVEVCGEVTSRI